MATAQNAGVAAEKKTRLTFAEFVAYVTNPVNAGKTRPEAAAAMGITVNNLQAKMVELRKAQEKLKTVAQQAGKTLPSIVEFTRAGSKKEHNAAESAMMALAGLE